MNWRVSKALWVGDEPQVRIRDGQGTIHEIRRTSSRWWIDVELTTPGRLWINQNFADGWGADAGTVLRDYDLLAVDLPPGRRLLQLRYAPSELVPCAVISALGFALMGLLWRRGKRSGS
jgi:hypothetical protein